ncbi:hypothetical protein, partial [Paenirhodobacter sp.]|uniref:hypothetical protein n=1 Tax=Paenirhodobacter sp. TaxID=1965326 RepID=UPI003B51267F
MEQDTGVPIRLIAGANALSATFRSACLHWTADKAKALASPLRLPAYRCSPPAMQRAPSATSEPLRFFRRLHLLSRMEHHAQDDEQFSPEVREGAVRLVDNEG